MGDILRALKDIGLPTILVVAGVVFLFVGIGGGFGATIVTEKIKPRSALMLGLVFFATGLVLAVSPSPGPVPTPPVPTLTNPPMPTPTNPPVSTPTNPPAPTPTNPPVSTPTNPPVSTPTNELVMGGFQGIVMDQTTGAKVNGAHLIFESEEGAARKEVTTDVNGSYRIELPQGRYRVTASHPDYETYSTGGGFFIVSGSEYQIGNIDLVRKAAPTGCGGVDVGGYCWYLGSDSTSCESVCASHGGYNEATRAYAGSNGSAANCQAVLSALGIPYSAFYNTSQGGLGCFIIPTVGGGYNGYWDQQPTTAIATYGVPGRRRACACQN